MLAARRRHGLTEQGTLVAPIGAPDRSRYRSASAAVRGELLRCLVRPLGTLGLAAVAAGAFTVLLEHGSRGMAALPLDQAGRFTGEQIAELAAFVAQVSPEALQQAMQLAFDAASRSV